MGYTETMGKIAVGCQRRPPAGRAPSAQNVVRKGPVSRRDLVRLADPGPPEEAEELVRLIYDLRRKSRPRLLVE